MSYLAIAKEAEAWGIGQKKACAATRPPAERRDRNGPTTPHPTAAGEVPAWPTASLCPVCRDGRFWRSIYGVTVCATCHPPAHPDLVAAEATAPGGPLR